MTKFITHNSLPAILPHSRFESRGYFFVEMAGVAGGACHAGLAREVSL